MAFQGMAPFGSLLAGALAARIGAPETLVIGGAICIAGAAYFGSQMPRIRAQVNPIFVEMGIGPE
jgi:fucose permease